MSSLTLEWIVLPFLIGFSIYLLPSTARLCALGCTIISGLYSLPWLLGESPLTLELLDSFGVTLIVDSASSYFILTNAVVTAAVILYCWTLQKKAYFFTQIVLIHGSVNAVFICADFISLYVALEAISISAFLLISYPRTNPSIWVALRYLLVGNTAMLFYLIGAVLVYQANHSFAFAGLTGSPPEAIALIFLGLLTKGGIFVSGLWLPYTHSESDTPVSALLSGIVVKTGVFPLLRLAAMMPDIAAVTQIFSVGTALFGACLAIFATDVKRLLAFSTISQLGFVLAAPQVGGFYALAHGAAKAALFLVTGKLPSRDFNALKQTPMATSVWLVLAVAGLSISGFPLLAGFGAKAAVLKEVSPWLGIALNVAAIGTAIIFAKPILLPHRKYEKRTITANLALAIALLVGVLAISNSFYWQAYTGANAFKALAIIGVGWGVYYAILHHFGPSIPRTIEKLEHLIGTMILLLVGLFLLVQA